MEGQSEDHPSLWSLGTRLATEREAAIDQRCRTIDHEAQTFLRQYGNHVFNKEIRMLARDFHGCILTIPNGRCHAERSDQELTLGHRVGCNDWFAPESRSNHA